MPRASTYTIYYTTQLYTIQYSVTTLYIWPYDRMAVDFLDPLGRGGKPINIPGGISWLNLVVLVERARIANPQLVSARCFEGGG